MAKVFLDANDVFSLSDPATVYGKKGGNEILIIKSGTTSVIADANIERIDLAGNVSDFTFQQTGNILNIYRAGVLVVKSTVQDDANGSQVAFANGMVSVGMEIGVTGPQMKLGGAIVSATAPATVVPVTIDTGTTSGATGGTGGTGGTVPPGPTDPKPQDLSSLAQTRSQIKTGIGSIATASTPDVATLLSGESWKKNVITYSMESVMPSDYASDSALSTGWKPLTNTEKAIVSGTFSVLGSLLNITFTELTSAGDIRLGAASMDDKTAGFAYYPYGTSSKDGDVWLNVANRSTPPSFYDPNDQGHKTIVHELGHALGLKHSFEDTPKLATDRDNNNYTVMSYTAGTNITMKFTYNSSDHNYAWQSSGIYPDQPMLLDVEALQSLYGANTQTRPGNDTYDYTSVTRNGYLSIWDAGGTDTLDFSTAPGRSVIDMKAGSISSVGLLTTDELTQRAVDDLVAQGGSRSFAQGFVSDAMNRSDIKPNLYLGAKNLSIVQGVWIENLNTGAGNDEVWDNAVDNRIFTGNGDDIIHLGAGGYDYVDAGAGFDTVVFNVTSTQVQRETQSDGSLLLVGSDFAAKLVGVEKLQFTDTSMLV